MQFHVQTDMTSVRRISKIQFYVHVPDFFHGMEVRSSAYVSTRTKPEAFCAVHVCPLEYKM